MLADTLLIPFILLLIIGMKTADKSANGFFEDYFSPKNTNALKGIFAVAVVIYHLGMVTNGSGSRLLIHCSGDFAVKFFFFASGYGLLSQFKSYKLRGENYAKGFLGRHLPKLLVPLLVLTLPYTLFFASGESYYGVGVITFDMFKELFLKNGLYVVFNAWFVFELLALYIIFYICFRFIGDYKKAVRFCVFGTVALMCGFYCLNTYLNYNNFWYYSTIAFAIGVLYASYKDKIDGFLKNNYDKVSVVLYPVLMCVALAFFAIKRCSSDTTGITSAENIILTPLFLLALMALLTKVQPGCKRFWSFMGKISYELYLVHGLFYLLYHSSFINIENPAFYVFAVMGSSIAAAVIIHYIDKLILKIYFWFYNLFHKEKGKKA